jgi:hypothetical protein
MLDDFERTLRATLEGEEPAPDRLVRLVDTLNDRLAERPAYSHILIRLFVDPSPAVGHEVRDHVETIVTRLLRFFREGVDRGEFRRLSSRHFFQSLLGMTLFHYASGPFGAAVLETGDLFTRENVAWRRVELRTLLLRGVLADPDPS